MTKILLIGVSVRAIVESAVHSNYPVMALDAFGDQDLRALADSYSLFRDFHVPYSASALFESGRQLDFDAVAYTSNLENHPEVLDRFAADHPIIGNSPQTIRLVRCWPKLFSKLDCAGFVVPETIFAGSERTVDLSCTWLAKPILSGGGHGIEFWREQTFSGTRYMLQRYVPGKACSASFVANGSDAVLLGVSEQLIGRRQFGVRRFRYCGSVLPLPEILETGASKTILDQVRRIAAFLTREFELTGVNGFDFILSGERVLLIEVNPRYCASMELAERAYGLPIFHLHVEAVLNRRLPEYALESRVNAGRFFAKAVLFCEKDCVAPVTLNDPSSDLRDVPMPGEILHPGSPICTLLSSGPDYQEVLADLDRRAAGLREQIYG